MSTTPKPPDDRPQQLRAIRDSIPGTGRKAQQKRLLAAIQQLGSITTLEASRCLDLYDPRARKMELTHQGHPVVMMWDRAETEAGVVHLYFLSSNKHDPDAGSTKAERKASEHSGVFHDPDLFEQCQVGGAA
jgi:hypothetical protein